MPIKNYTTEVPAHRSIQSIQDALVKRGVQGFISHYEKGTGRIAELSFGLEVDGQVIGYRLPLRWRNVQQVLISQGVSKAKKDEEYVYRVAWRILHDWVMVQIALVEIEMVQMQEIFLPYAVTKSGQTVFESMAGQPDRLLN